MPDTNLEPPPVTSVISLGAGVQSTTLLLAAKLAKELPFEEWRTALLIRAGVPDEDARRAYDELRAVDVAIFADTGWEPPAVYAHLDRIELELAKPAGIEIRRVTNGNIRDDALDPDHRFASMPLHVEGPCSLCAGEGAIEEWYPHPDLIADPPKWLQAHARKQGVTVEEIEAFPAYDGPCPRCKGTGRQRGMARRQCTNEYKLVPIKREVRRLLGYPHPVRVPKGVRVLQLIGISRDEVWRAKDSGIKYSTNVFPLLDLDLRRRDCLRILHRYGLETTVKSACIGCPFHGNVTWRGMRDRHPEEWADVVAFDSEIRKGHAAATAQGQELRGSMYLHRSMLPLAEAPIDRKSRTEKAAAQLDLIDLAEDLEAGVDVDAYDTEDLGIEQGCSPWGCRTDGL